MKAFTAAVLGGIGNIPGAMVGGMVLGLLEAFAASYLSLLTGGAFGAEYKDIFAFLMLILILIFRPKGLLGETVRETQGVRRSLAGLGRSAFTSRPAARWPISFPSRCWSFCSSGSLLLLYYMPVQRAG